MIRGLLKLSVGHIQSDALTFVEFTTHLKKKTVSLVLIPSLVLIFKTPTN